MRRFAWSTIAAAAVSVNCGIADAAVQAEFDASGIGMDLAIDTFSFDMVNYIPSSAGSGPTANVNDVTITRKTDSASPQLVNAALNGTHISDVEIRFCRATCDAASDYMKFVLENALINSYTTGPGGGGVPSESISFNYERMLMEYFEQSEPPAPPKTAWDAILPQMLPAGGVAPYQFHFALDAAVVEGLFDRPLSALGDSLPATLLHVNFIPEPATTWITLSAVCCAAGLRRFARSSHGR
jgi:type VI secretion system secreted protein Hcp